MVVAHCAISTRVFLSYGAFALGVSWELPEITVYREYLQNLGRAAVPLVRASGQRLFGGPFGGKNEQSAKPRVSGPNKSLVRNTAIPESDSLLSICSPFSEGRQIRFMAPSDKWQVAENQPAAFRAQRKIGLSVASLEQA